MKRKQKELQEALKRLEKCCPTGLSDEVQQALTAELREALYDLDTARSREKFLRKESDALLEGMNHVIRSENTLTAFKAVLEVLKKLLGFDDAFVLRQQDEDSLYALASTSPVFENLLWSVGPMFKRVLTGSSVNLRDISISTDWQAHPPEVSRNVSSALHTPFNTTTAKAVLVCTSSQSCYFNKSSIKLLERFSPLAGQALHNLEINDHLRDEISERKEAEIKLASTLADLQNTQEELLTTNEALTSENEERRKAEGALIQAHDELEEKVELRTSELRENNMLLKSEVIERRRAEEEKAVLLREIHHRVKNNMQVISSLLSLQADQSDDNRFINKFNDTQHRIKSMSLVHEMLYKSEDLSNISFKEYVDALTHSLVSFYSDASERISFTLDVDEVSLGIDTAIPCGLVLNELLSNCLKHALPDGRTGMMSLTFHKAMHEGGAEYEMVVKDDGIGLPLDIDLNKTESLGLQLIMTLIVHQLTGTVELDRTDGTAYHIRFKEMVYKKRL